MKIIAGKIDVTKIEKERLYKGKKGTYLDITIFLNNYKDKYGNHGFITQSVSKEEREQGVKSSILGNIKVVFEKNREPGEDDDKGENDGDEWPDKTFDDDLPF